MDLLNERQVHSQMQLREKYMEEIRQRKLERDRRKQERIANGLSDEVPERVDSAGSDSSKDEGVHSNGEKAEDDINEEDLAQHDLGGLRKYAASEVDDDEDEGMGSMVGEKIKDDPDDPDEDRSRPLTAISEHKATTSLMEDSASAGYSADTEDSPEEQEAVAASEPISEEPEVVNEEQETAETGEPEAAEAESDSTEPATEEAESEPAAEAEPMEAEVESEVKEPDDAPQEAAEPESVPPILEAMEHDSESNEPVVLEDETQPMETANTENSEEARDITTSEKPPDTSRRRRKKKLFFDLDKVTANRKPLSIRAQPLEKPVVETNAPQKKISIKRPSLAQPVSSKKENENFKPHLKSKYELQRQNRLKYKVKLKKPSPLSKEQIESSNPEGPTDSSSAAPVELTVTDAPVDDDTQLEEAEKRDFVNPLMDHSMPRPVAPHQRKLSESSSPSKMGSGSSPKTEVWVPGEDQLYVYSYSSLPRLLHIKRLGGKRVATTSSTDTDPNSSFRVKNRSGRVIRGTNFGKDGAPKWNPYFAYARCLSANDYTFYETDEMRQRREEFRERMKVKAKERKEHLGVSNIFRTTNGTAHHLSNYTSVRRTTNQPGYSLSKLYKPPRTYPHHNGHSLHADQSIPFGNYTSRFDRNYARPPCVSIGIQVYSEELAELDSSVSAEVAVVKALVSNILREAALEVANEAEADGAKMEQLAARRLSLMGEGETPKSLDTEDEVRKDPEGEETPPEEAEAAPTEDAEAEAAPVDEDPPADPEETPAEDAEGVIGKGEDQSELEEVPAG